MGHSLQWSRSKESEEGKTRYGDSAELIKYAKNADLVVRSGETITLPVIAYYGTMRLWQAPLHKLREESRITHPKVLSDQRRITRFEGYRHSVDPRMSVRNLITWFARQAWATFQEGETTHSLRVVREAVLGCLENATALYFDAKMGELLTTIGGHTQPFSNLSDGQRCTLAMVADIAQKAEWLNPHLSDNFLTDTPGVVLIDELDLHLHPKWQRRIIEDLRRTFPKIQFICTTHSPQLIGQAKADEIILLDVPNRGHPGQSFGMDSNWVLRHIMGSVDRDPEVAAKLDAIFEAIEDAQFDKAKESVSSLRAEIGDHPELAEAEALIGRYTRFPEIEED